MPTVFVQKTELSYEDADVIMLEEGFIGLPGLRRMVLVGQTSIEPFLWLVSLDVKEMAFLVVEPTRLFPSFDPAIPADLNARLKLGGSAPVYISLVGLDEDWTKSTINLRAPLVINPDTKSAVQVVLMDSQYSVQQPFPQAQVAA